MTRAVPILGSVLRRAERGAVRSLHGLIARWYLRKPDLVELLDLKFPDLGSVARAAGNELAYRLRREQVSRVLSLNIETTNYCNLRCSICPVNNGMERAKRYLDPGLFQRWIDQTPGLRFLLPFQWGEPLLHPEIHTMIRYAHERGVRTMMTTNGTLLTERTVARLLESGLDRLTISVDGDDETHEQIRGVPLERIRERVRDLRQARDRRRASMRIDVSMVLDERTRSAIEHYRSSWRDLADRVQVIPKLVARPRPRTRACREPWRGSLVLLVDGTVTTCCADSEGRLALGDATKESPSSIFAGERFRELRRLHACGEFPEICAQCGEYEGQDLGVSPRFDR